MELGELMQEFGPAVSRICSSYEFNEERRKELYQDIWVEIWRGLNSFKGESSPKTWLYRIAINTAISHVTREKKHLSGQTLEEIESRWASSDPSSKFEFKETLQFVNEILKRLKPTDKQIFVLFLEGSKQSEISEITGLSETNVSTRISRIKNFLRTQISNPENKDERSQ